jgi:hypothetical protein
MMPSIFQKYFFRDNVVACRLIFQKTINFFDKLPNIYHAITKDEFPLWFSEGKCGDTTRALGTWL